MYIGDYWDITHALQALEAPGTGKKIQEKIIQDRSSPTKPR